MSNIWVEVGICLYVLTCIVLIIRNFMVATKDSGSSGGTGLSLIGFFMNRPVQPPGDTEQTT